MATHLTIDELLALRDGEGPASAQRHLATCAACGEALERLHQRAAALKALPEFRPSRDRWPMIQARLISERRQTRRWIGVGGVAAAAIFAMVFGFSQFAPIPSNSSPEADLAALIEESQRLESMLQSVGQEGRVMNGITAAAIADLEDRIALVDAGLTEGRMRQMTASELRPFWEQRVTLMGALVNTHVRQVGYVGF